MVRTLSYLRALILPAFIIAETLFLSFFLFIGLLFGAGTGYADLIVRTLWSRSFLKMAGVSVEIQGAENIPANNGFLYLFSHSSLYDIPVLYGYAPKTFRFGAKIELFSIPVFGWAMNAVGTLKIARDNRAEVFEVYRQAEERVAKGEAFALSPEGGRRQTKELAPFKTGPFIFAINAKMPVVPVLIYGAEEVLPNGSLLLNKDRWRSKVILKFLQPHSIEGYTTDTAKVLKEKVRVQMVSDYEELRKQPLVD